MRVRVCTREQVGVQPSVYAWYRFADVKNSKLFLEPWDRGERGAFPTSACHPEGARRASRSFAEKNRLLHLRFQNGSAVLHSGKDMLRFLICIGRDEPFGAKPNPACRVRDLLRV